MLCSVCPIDEAIVEKALASTFTDFEDALQYYSALQTQCEIIIMRNGKHFKNVQLPVLTAEEFLAR